MGLKDFFSRQGKEYENYFDDQDYIETETYYAELNKSMSGVMGNNVTQNNNKQVNPPETVNKPVNKEHKVTPQKPQEAKKVAQVADTKKDIHKNVTVYDNYNDTSGDLKEGTKKIFNLEDVRGGMPNSPYYNDYAFNADDTIPFFDKFLKLPKIEPLQKRSAIVFVVENTISVNEYKKEIYTLINKMCSDNQTSFFLFLRSGNEENNFGVFDLNELKTSKVIEKLLSEESCKSNCVDICSQIENIDNFLSSIAKEKPREKYSYHKDKNVFEYKNENYEITDVNVIFIGTGSCDEEVSPIAKTTKKIDKLSKKELIRTIKYFCIRDYDMINAAKLGFSVIAHIVSNFYK